MSFLARFFTSIGFLKKKATILVVGLDNSGKTTIINWVKNGTTSENTVPTIGFNVEQFSRGKLNFTVFDMSGQERYRSLWEHYYPDAEAIIFVVDTSDRLRACVARDELEQLLEHKVLAVKKIPILFFANKLDMPGCMTPVECASTLGLENIKDKPWHIRGCTAITGQGVDEGLDWLADQLAT